MHDFRINNLNSSVSTNRIDSRLWVWFSWVSCLFFATFLVVDRALFNLLALLLVIIAIAILYNYRPRWDTELRVFAWVLGANLLLAFPNLVMGRDSLISLENPIRMLIMLPIMLAVARHGLKVRFICIGLAVGILVAAFVVSWQYYVQEVSRPGIHYNPLHFSKVAMSTFAVLLAAGLVIRDRWSPLYLVASLAGVYCVILSGSRGTLLAIVPMTLFLLWWRWRSGTLTKVISRHRAFWVPAIMVILGVLLLSSGQFIKRVDIAVKQTTNYLESSEARNSISKRLEVWRGALMAGREHLFLGIGYRDFRTYLKQNIDEGVLMPYVANMHHAHNDYLGAFHARGVPGLLLQLLIYTLPMLIFVRGLSTMKSEALFASLGGGLMTIGYATYSLTSVPMRNGMPLVFYIVTISLCIGIIKHSQSAVSENHSRQPGQ